MRPPTLPIGGAADGTSTALGTASATASVDEMDRARQWAVQCTLSDSPAAAAPALALPTDLVATAVLVGPGLRGSVGALELRGGHFDADELQTLRDLGAGPGSTGGLALRESSAAAPQAAGGSGGGGGGSGGVLRCVPAEWCDECSDGRGPGAASGARAVSVSGRGALHSLRASWR